MWQKNNGTNFVFIFFIHHFYYPFYNNSLGKLYLGVDVVSILVAALEALNWYGLQHFRYTFLQVPKGHSLRKFHSLEQKKKSKPKEYLLRSKFSEGEGSDLSDIRSHKNGSF